MFGNRRNAELIRKMKKQGRTAVGTVVSVTAVSDIEQLIGIRTGTARHPYNVVIRFRTEEGRDEQLTMHTSDISSYSEGFEVNVRYFYKNGTCLAVPELLLEKPDKQRSE